MPHADLSSLSSGASGLCTKSGSAQEPGNGVCAEGPLDKALLRENRLLHRFKGRGGSQVQGDPPLGPLCITSFTDICLPYSSRSPCRVEQW